MASAKASFSGLDSLTKLQDRAPLMDRAQEALENALEKGEEAMKEMVATRGTGKTWSHPWRGREGSYPGRVDTGNMQKEVRGEITERTPRRVAGNLGWDENSADYIRLQDNGFRHVLAGEDVEGMMALRDGAEIAKNSLISDLQDIASAYR